MSQFLRFILLLAVIAAVAAGVYFYFEEQKGPLERAGEDADEALEELERKTDEAVDGLQPESPSLR